MSKVLAFAICLAALVPACSKGPSATSAPPPQAPAGHALVTVNGTPVTEEQYRLEIERVPEYAREQFTGADGARRFLDELVHRELLYQEALSKGLDQDPAFLAGLESYRRARLADLLIQSEVKARGEVTDQEMQAFYEANRSSFVVPEKVRAAHILIREKAEADEILRRARSGADFAGLARKQSIDEATREDGGDLGAFPRGQMSPEFDSVAFSLKPGEVGGPVRTEKGYHIIKVMERKESEAVSLDRIADFLRDRLTQEKRKTVYDDLIGKLKETATVSEPDELALQKLGSTPAP